MEHQALQEIITGFKNEIQKHYSQPLSFKIYNAQADQNVEYALIKQMRELNYDLVVPIATQTTLMTMNLINKTPLVGLAADVSDEQRKKLKSCNIAVVDDEIQGSEKFNFIHLVYPQIKKMVLIHSLSDKLLPEVEDAKKAAEAVGISLQTMTIQNLMDLQMVTRSLPDNIDGIFILKDSLVASGISQLTQLAKKNTIPLIII